VFEWAYGISDIVNRLTIDRVWGGQAESAAMMLASLRYYGKWTVMGKDKKWVSVCPTVEERLEISRQHMKELKQLEHVKAALEPKTYQYTVNQSAYNHGTVVSKPKQDKYHVPNAPKWYKKSHYYVNDVKRKMREEYNDFSHAHIYKGNTSISLCNELLWVYFNFSGHKERMDALMNAIEKNGRDKNTSETLEPQASDSVMKGDRFIKFLDMIQVLKDIVPSFVKDKDECGGHNDHELANVSKKLDNWVGKLDKEQQKLWTAQFLSYNKTNQSKTKKRRMSRSDLIHHSLEKFWENKK
jgi:hypothetical protein